MSTATSMPTLASVLDEVAKWKADEETRQNAELLEVDQEVQSLQTAVVNLQQQLEALAKFREELVAKGSTLGEEEIQRSYDAIFSMLASQKELALQRTAQVSVANEGRQAAIEEALASSEIAPLLDEYKQFKAAVEPTLSALPESYRTVMMKHHEQLTEQLKAHVSAAASTPLDLDVDDLTLEIVFAIDAPEDKPELLIVVIPTSEEASTDGRAEDLQALIAARVAQALYQTIRTCGPEGAEAISGGHQGMLAIEVDLLGASDDFGAKFSQELEQAVENASELGAAGISLEARQVAVDFLLPSDDLSQGE